MTGSIELLLKNPVNFLDDSGPDEDIAISSRIRLARNLAGRPFPAAAALEQSREVCELVSAAAEKNADSRGKKLLCFDPGEMNQVDREILLERRLASRELIEHPEAARLLVCPEEGCSIMINEEDQLRIQSIRPGFQLNKVWNEIEHIDNALEAELKYAFDPQLGYLTSCPTNTGTGMRASVMLHLPGLVLSGQIGPTIQGVNKLHLAVRGFFGEGSDNRGNLFQISNQSTLGESEEQIITNLNNVISQLIAHEKNARRMLLEHDRFGVLDLVGRSYGVLRHSYKLSGEEALKCLSGVRFGVDMGLFNSLGIHKVNELFIAIGAAHLQKQAGRALTSPERDVCRAELCRNKLKQP